jgi:hypothetical protein
MGPSVSTAGNRLSRWLQHRNAHWLIKKKYQDQQFQMYHGAMALLKIDLNRSRWPRILIGRSRWVAAAPVGYPDSRKEVEAYLGIARGSRCNPSQVRVTVGYSGALGLSIRGLQLERMGAWMENPVPRSFYPREWVPGRLAVEASFAEDTVADLNKRGRQLELHREWERVTP